MKISKSEIIEQNNEVEIRFQIEFSKGSETLWFSLNQTYGDLVSNSCDAPLVALLIPAMTNGEDIQVSGAISEKLYYNLSGPYQKLLQHIIPTLHRIEIRPEEIYTETVRAPGVATGFSGGVDSYCALADHYYLGLPGAPKISHLLFNNIGSHGGGKIGEQRFQQRYSRLEATAESIGLPLIMVNSNVNAFYPGYTFQQTHTPRNASVAHMLRRGIGRFLYASTYSFPEVYIGQTYDMAYSDPIALPLLSTETLDAFSVGSEYSRVEKTLRIAEVTDTYSTLDVCTNPDHSGTHTNCSECWKCMRTLLTLEIAGKIGCYSNSFDIEAYNSKRNWFIGLAQISDDPLLREIVKYAKSQQYSFPFQSRLISLLYSAVRLIKRILRLPLPGARKS